MHHLIQRKPNPHRIIAGHGHRCSGQRRSAAHRSAAAAPALRSRPDAEGTTTKLCMPWQSACRGTLTLQRAISAAIVSLGASGRTCDRSLTGSEPGVREQHGSIATGNGTPRHPRKDQPRLRRRAQAYASTYRVARSLASDDSVGLLRSPTVDIIGEHALACARARADTTTRPRPRPRRRAQRTRAHKTYATPCAQRTSAMHDRQAGRQTGPTACVCACALDGAVHGVGRQGSVAFAHKVHRVCLVALLCDHLFRRDLQRRTVARTEAPSALADRRTDRRAAVARFTVPRPQQTTVAQKPGRPANMCA
jgi:hypothetical protein